MDYGAYKMNTQFLSSNSLKQKGNLFAFTNPTNVSEIIKIPIFSEITTHTT